MNCLVCNEKIDRSDSTKVDCSDCKSIFHGPCVNIQPADIEYMCTNNLKHRCDKCSALRRKSLQQQPVSNILTPESAAKLHTAVKQQKPTTTSKQHVPVPAVKHQNQLSAEKQQKATTK